MALGKAFPPNQQIPELLEMLYIVVEAVNINMRFQEPLADLKEVASGLRNGTSSSSGN